jgi:Ca-activated chloride channel family protein
MGRRFQAFLLFASVLVFGVILPAQVRVDVRLVNVVATVTDARGRSVSNLKMEDFVLEEDGRPQQITHFSQDAEAPVSVGILLDASGSMNRRIRTAVEAVERFSRRIHEDDDIFLISFSDRPVLRQDFTDDRDKLSQALRRLNATGGTALYDALTNGLEKIRSGRHHKRAILLLTDGQDTASTAKLDDVVKSIRRSDLLVYPVGISGLTYANDFDPSSVRVLSAMFPVGAAQRTQNRSDEVDFNVLRTLAENSGGRAFMLAESLINRGGQIEKVLDAIADELRSQYTLGFYPSRPDDGRYHSLRVRARNGNIVRARRGYLSVTPDDAFTNRKP